VDEPLDAFLQPDKDAEIGDAGDLAFHLRADGIFLGDYMPGVGGELLDTEGEALVLHVDAEHLRFDDVAFLIKLRRMLDLFGPMKVRDVHQTVDALFDPDEDAEVGDAPHRSLNDGADGIFLLRLLPGIRHHLLEAERDAAVVRIDIQHDHLDHLTHLHHLGGMRDLFGPRHLGDVDQSFDTPLELNERGVVDQAHDLALQACPDGKLIRDRVPRVGHDLLHAEGNALALGVEFEDHDFDAVAHFHHLRGMADAPPGHVADVQDAVDAT